ncbi:MAG: hypothetical protein U5L74_11030, partial [Ideonella sp.]|nr:hypothetical protein [Ideonella sp.]
QLGASGHEDNLGLRVGNTYEKLSLGYIAPKVSEVSWPLPSKPAKAVTIMLDAKSDGAASRNQRHQARHR